MPNTSCCDCCTGRALHNGADACRSLALWVRTRAHIAFTLPPAVVLNLSVMTSFQCCLAPNAVTSPITAITGLCYAKSSTRVYYSCCVLLQTVPAVSAVCPSHLSYPVDGLSLKEGVLLSLLYVSRVACSESRQPARCHARRRMI